MSENFWVRTVTLSIVFWSCRALAVALPLIAQSPSDAPVEVFQGKTEREESLNYADRTLRLTVTVEDTSFLLVKEGQEIKVGDTITDNKLERDRLNKQRQAVTLQIDNLKSKPIPEPIKPIKPPKLAQLPPVSFKEEEAVIAQAQLKAKQAQALLQSRTPMLLADNPGQRAEAEKAESAFRLAEEKVREQEELLLTMQDMKLQSPIIRHEQSKLKSLQSEAEQSKSLLEQARAKLNAAGVEQQQQLQALQTAVQVARSELELASSRLNTAHNNRKLLEYKASIEVAQRIEQENRSQQEWSQQQQQYAQNLRDRDYQLAQLNLSLSALDDKLSQIPVVRSPRNGYVRRIKPWVGNNGRYTTTLTISANAPESAVKGKKLNTSTTNEDS
ncbi:hypothetical protein [Iningainema tapete]|uniref:Uncharacterized protein n=1 Tax=Iningainema tapete BLCC-T55 TaxID=2748662 RepID=A0A8J6XI78_9CYAN|nr:hypothetical protein [Iningainema tapete]MBD2770677.1 hypothetical protein [Iningainema tapete BLCC-T55]